jgi:tetratricopeptide (TPR) repeat protein
MDKLKCLVIACLLPVFLHAQTDEPQLLGKCSLNDLKEAPYGEWFTKNYDDYHPRPDIVEQLRAVDWKDYTVTIFLGTWCGDSRREAPRLIKTLDAAGFPQSGITVIAISSEDSVYKQSPGREERGNHIYRAPTFVISQNGRELNRIVEIPVTSLERDLLAILNRNYTPNYPSYIYLSGWYDEGVLNDTNASLRGMARQLKYLAQSASELDNFGRVLAKSGTEGSSEAAINVFKINAYLYPEAWSTYANLAEILYKKGDYEAAGQAIRKAFELNRDSRNVNGLLKLNDEIKQPHNDR